MASNSSVGSLLIDIGLSTARLSSDVGKAGQTIKSFTDKAAREFESFKSVAAGLVGVLAGGAGAAGLLSFSRAVINSADEMNKASQKYGIGVESLSALKYSAQLADVEFEALGTGLKKLSTAMSEGNKAFGLIGVSVKDASGNLRSTEDVLADVADRFAGMEDGAGKTAFAVKLFGKAGADLIPFLNGGSKGIRENTEEAKKLGAVWSGETAKAAEEFNDNMTRLTTASKALGKSIVSEILPGLADTTAGMVKWASTGDNLRSSMALLADTVKVLAAASLPLVVSKLAAAAGGMASLSFAVQNLGFVLRYFAVTTLGPMLLNPITIAVAAVAALAAGYLYLTGKAGDAAEAQKRFASTLAGESRGALKAQADAVAYALDEAIRYEARWNQIADERHAAGNNLSAASARRAANAWAEKRTEYQGMIDEIEKARIKIDQLESDTGGGRTAAPQLSSLDGKKGKASDPMTAHVEEFERQKIAQQFQMDGFVKIDALRKKAVEDQRKADKERADAAEGMIGYMTRAEILEKGRGELERQRYLSAVTAARIQSEMDAQRDEEERTRIAATAEFKKQMYASMSPAARFDSAAAEGDTGGMLDALNTDGFGEKLLAIDEARAKSEAFMEVWRSANLTMGQAMTSIGMGIRDSITSNLTSVITGAKTAAQAFKDLGKSVLSMLAEMLVKWVVNRLIMAAIGKTAQAAETAASVAAGSAVATAWAPAAAAVSLASFGSNSLPAAAGITAVYGLTQALSVPALAEGGIIERPTLVLAGEAGREAIVPLDKGGADLGGGRPINLHLDGRVIARWIENAVRTGELNLVPA